MSDTSTIPKETILALAHTAPEDVVALLCDALGCLSYLDEGEWHESTGCLVLNESQVAHIREARKFLDAVLESFMLAMKARKG